jgi:hypothetical protein
MEADLSGSGSQLRITAECRTAELTLLWYTRSRLCTIGHAADQLMTAVFREG